MKYKQLDRTIQKQSLKNIDFYYASKNNNRVQLRIQKSYTSSDLQMQQSLQQSGWKNCILPKEVLFYNDTLFTEYELFDGDCCQLKMQKKPQEWIEQFIIDVGNGLQQMHQDNYIHIDLKPANIVYKYENNTYRFAICDFGSLLKVEETKSKECLGSPLYMPYEMNEREQIKKDGLTTAVDVWAFGVTLFELIANKDLFDEKTITQKGNQQLINQQILTVQDQFYQNLLTQLLQVDPQKRIPIKKFLEFFQKLKTKENIIIHQPIIDTQLIHIKLKTLKDFVSEYIYDYYMNEESDPPDLPIQNKLGYQNRLALIIDIIKLLMKLRKYRLIIYNKQ